MRTCRPANVVDWANAARVKKVDSSRLNRTSLKHCHTMMGWLLPTILQVWIDHGSDEDWGPMCYPPVKMISAMRNGR